jgi:hypothetical protein
MDGTVDKILDKGNDYGQENQVIGFMFKDKNSLLGSKIANNTSADKEKK